MFIRVFIEARFYMYLRTKFVAQCRVLA
jgi:hypothetical protein